MPDMEKVIKKAERIMCSTVDRDMIDSFCEDVIDLLKEQPEIVHCEECDKYDQETGRCTNKTVHGNAKIWFCADGKRR